MTYCFSRTVLGDFDAVAAATREALRKEGFGVITEIDVSATFKARLNRDFRDYLILGACDPAMAAAALDIDAKIGVLLPCNVVIQKVDGGVEVSVVDPAATIGGAGNPALLAIAGSVGQRLRAMVAHL